MLIDDAIVYDIETYPNVFLLTAGRLDGTLIATWEISETDRERRDDRSSLLQWFANLTMYQIPMIGFNSLAFDYPVIHFIWSNPYATVAEIYAKAQACIRSDPHRTGYGQSTQLVWASERFAPQIDLFKIHHFDNKAKTTSLKQLQINMRLPTVVACPLPFDINLTREQIDTQLIPYNCHDVYGTTVFAQYSMLAIRFRAGMMDKLRGDVLNWNDTKVGEEMLAQRLGKDVTHEWHEYAIDFQGTTRTERVRKQTPRSRIALADIIFPYIRFTNSEFQRVLDFMRGQVLTGDSLNGTVRELETLYTTDSEGRTARIDTVKTKGVFTDLNARVGGLQFHFGTGGVHASVERRVYRACSDYMLFDIDVGGLYPDIAIKNQLAPAHLGAAFISEYAKIPVERKLHAKGTYENAALKLAANGAWGKSNSPFSVFYDPQYAMTIPINGQLLLCMLVEHLVTVPTLELIQANTDGVTYRVHRAMQCYAMQVCKWWESYTCLTLEYAEYSRMWIRDVNNYIAEDIKGKLKQKGAYWHPDPNNYADSISQHSPPCWYKDLGNVVSIRAAVARMVYGVDVAGFIRSHRDPFDFMLRAKGRLHLGGQQIQSPSRYYIAINGAELQKIDPPPEGCERGAFKQASGVSRAEYLDVMKETGGAWDPRVCTKNKSVYKDRVTSIESGWRVAECNDVRSFDWSNVDYAYYIHEADKLVII